MIDPTVNGEPEDLDLGAIREKLANSTGRDYWRGLEEVAETPEFQKWIGDEFPNRSSLIGLDRRDFLKFMGASLAIAGVAGCRVLPQEKIVPYVKQPEDLTPGKPVSFATTLSVGGYGVGMLISSREGRPIKVEGNPEHPASLGSTDIFAQASLHQLYDPDRLQSPQKNGQFTSNADSISDLSAIISKLNQSEVKPVRILTETVTSPAFGALLQDLLAKHKGVEWHQYSVSGHGCRNGGKLATGEYLRPVYHIDKSDRVLALDGDLFLDGPGAVRYTRDFADKRRVGAGKEDMIRLYAVESMPTLTGANADHRLRVRASEVEGFARALLATLSGGSVTSKVNEKFLSEVAKDLQAAGKAALVTVGESQPAVVHALGAAINDKLGSIGTTVTYIQSPEARPEDQSASLAKLVDDMGKGQVEVVIIIGGNPSYSCPSDLKFHEALAKVPNRIRLSMYPDETARACNFVFPQAHAVEAWGDFRAFDGTASIAQPLILPLYEQAKSEMEFVSALFGSPKPGYDIVRNYWKAQPSAGDFDKNWERWLNDGVIADSVYPPKTPVINAAGIPAQSPESGAFEVMYKIDPCVGDGSFANCGWMQELPKPISKLTWDNAAYISVATAQKLNLKSGDVVEITVGDSNVKAPVWVLPGHPDNSATVNFGYGRDHAGVVGDGIGFNAYDIWNSAAPSFALNASIKKTDASHRLVTTQTQWTMEGRDMVRMRPLDDWKKEEASTPTNGEAEEGKKEGKPASLYNLSQAEGWKSGFVQWGMVIDLTSCIGCNACAIACQAENNIPVVGKEQVANGRHMNWIRIDRYYATEAKNASNVDEPSTLFMPVPCMHCEKAPCEPVCPVGATVHSHEGLNQMVYNRCVGTRYCSNNCPYKVRRFNFLNFANDHSIPVKKLLTNPDVTVRGRGVMEKCTYCVQRISAERIRQKAAGLEFDGKGIVTACEQVCPTKAITFGNIDDASTEVFKKRKEKAHYSLLDELNTIPRTTYLERIFNPNPALSASHGKAEG